MATIYFNNKSFEIPEAALNVASGTLRQHFSTVINGTGATINFSGISYNVDSTKLTAVKNEFISHLSTVAGSGKKVVMDGREYGVDSTKLADTISDIEAVLAGTEEERPDDNTSGEIINYKSETVVLDENSTSLTIGNIAEYGYVENRHCYFYDSDCLVVTLNDFELVIDKTALVSETGAVPVQSNTVIGQYNGIDILCKIMKDRRTGFMPMTISLSEAPTEPISASVTYKTLVTT